MPVQVAVPRKGRPLEAVLDHLAGRPAVSVPDGDVTGLADQTVSTLRHEKAVTKAEADAEGGVYERLAAYSDLEDPYHPEFTVLRDDRPGKPRRVVFDALRVRVDGVEVDLVGREEPFRALRTHAFPLGFDSADLVLEEVVSLEPEPLRRIADLNARIDPHDTDVRVVTGLGDTVHHTLLATPETAGSAVLDRGFLADYEGPLCVSPRYERLVEAVLGTDATGGVSFEHPEAGVEEEAAIAEAGAGVYLTETGATAREHGLVVGERLFPSETVLLENVVERDDTVGRVADALVAPEAETAVL
jgi:hypothetical protein